MTVKELRGIIEDLPDDLDVMIPCNPMSGFDGQWFSPCVEDSGIIQFGVTDDPDSEFVSERDVVALLPCGFDEKSEEIEKAALN